MRGALAARDNTQFTQRTGLDYDGLPTAVRHLRWSGAEAPNPHDATYLYEVYQRNQVPAAKSADGSRYATTVLWGNNGAFQWHPSNYVDSYYAGQPYPSPPIAGDGKWEIATAAGDHRDLADGTPEASVPYPTYNQWYRQVLRALNPGAGSYNYRYWFDVAAGVGTDKYIEVNRTQWFTPTTPCLSIGQTPGTTLDDAASLTSYGGLSRREENNMVIRKLQFFQANVSIGDCQTLFAAETDDEARAIQISLGLTPFYTCINPKPWDTRDRGPGAHHPTFIGPARPTLWHS